MELRVKVQSIFRKKFSVEPLLVRAPGRVNLIGEHTDYNEGFVFPASIEQEICFAFGKSGSEKCEIYALDLKEDYHCNLSEIKPLPINSWQNYVLGVVSEIAKTGSALGGFNLVFSGNVPEGAGMSSSAALECGTCFGLNELFDLQMDKLEMVKISQLAEHNYAGVMCGIMDQFASMMGRVDRAFMLDCRSLAYEYFPVELGDFHFLLINSNVTHNLASSEYNVRKQQCDEGVRLIKRKFPQTRSLRDVSLSQLDASVLDTSSLIYKRCKYVIEENMRVRDFSEALKDKNLQRVGDLLNAAHYGMRYEYEITCPEIDFMIDFAFLRSEVLGARMMGGGFGGCTLNLIKRETEGEFVRSLERTYHQQFGLEITPIPIAIAQGTSLMD